MGFKRIRWLVRNLGTTMLDGRLWSADGLTHIDLLCLRAGGSVLGLCGGRYIVCSRRRLCSWSWRRRVLNGRRQRRYLTGRRGWSRRWRSSGGWRRQHFRYGFSMHLSSLDVPQLGQQNVCHFHGHSAEVGDKMDTSCMTCKRTLGAFASILLPKWQHVTTVATPTGAEIAERLESMGNPMIDLFLVALLERIRYISKSDKGKVISRSPSTYRVRVRL